MRKNGFAFIETIITVVILTASLLFLYNSYSSIIENEKKRLYYDDISYIYKTNNLKKLLITTSNINNIKSFLFNEKNPYIEPIGSKYEGLFSDENQIMFQNLCDEYFVHQMVLINTELFDACIALDANCKDYMFEVYNYNFKNYINSLSEGEGKYKYILAVEYSYKKEDNTKHHCEYGIDTNCNAYYASVGINLKEETLAEYIKGLYTTDGVNGLYLHDADLANGANDGSYRYAASPENWTTTLVHYDNDTNRNNNWMFLGVNNWTISIAWTIRVVRSMWTALVM